MRLARSRRATLGFVCGGALLGLTLPASAYPRPGETVTVPATVAGAAKECCVYGVAISGDGRRVAFQSGNNDFVASAGGPTFDTYVRDFATGTTRRVTVASDGTRAVGSTQYPNTFGDVTTVDLSNDGRFVAFMSNAANLVPGDTNSRHDVFVHDLETGLTERVSVATGGGQMADGGYSPNISSNGRYVAFSSDGLFVRDRVTGVTERVDVSSTEDPSNFYGYGPSVSDDGRWVAFQSSASNLVIDSMEWIYASGSAIYLRDRVEGTTIRITGPAPDTKANGYSYMPDISGDGRYIAYYSAATDLVPQDTNRANDVFLYDRDSGATRRVSVASDGSEASPTSSSYAVAISQDGRYVTYTSTAINLVPGDTNAAADVFVHDVLLGTTERASIGTGGGQTAIGVNATVSAVSADGAYVAYEEAASGVQTVRRRQRGAPISLVSANASAVGSQAQVTGVAAFAGAVVSAATDQTSPPPALEIGGADLARVELAVRTELEDLRVRFVVPGLPSAQVSGLAGRFICFQTGCPPSMTTSPYVGYRLDFSLGGVVHRLVVDEAGAVVLRCAPVCAPLGAAIAQVGGTGQEVVLAIPLSLLGGAAGQSITEVSAASTLLGEAVGSVQDLDTVALPDGTLAAPTVQLGVAPAGTPLQSVSFTGSAAATGGTFAGAVVVPPALVGDVDVWLRPCVGSTCGEPVSRLVASGSEPVVPDAPYTVLLVVVAVAVLGGVVVRGRGPVGAGLPRGDVG